MWRAPSSASSAGDAVICAANLGEGRGVGLLPEEEREGLQALVAGDGGFGAALRFVGEIEIFELGLLEGGEDFGFELGGEFALFVDGGEDGLAAVFELAEVLEFFLDVADLDFVEVAGDFFAIAGNEGDGRAFVEEGDDGGHSLEGNGQQFGNVKKHGGGESLRVSHGPSGTSMIPRSSKVKGMSRKGAKDAKKTNKKIGLAFLGFLCGLCAFARNYSSNPLAMRVMPSLIRATLKLMSRPRRLSESLGIPL